MKWPDYPSKHRVNRYVLDAERLADSKDSTWGSILGSILIGLILGAILLYAGISEGAETGNIVDQIGSRPIEHTVGQMQAGEVGYTVPWAVNDGNINLDYPVSKHAGGTVELKVQCVTPGKYVIDWSLVTLPE